MTEEMRRLVEANNECLNHESIEYFTNEIRCKTAALGASLEREITLKNEVLSLVEELATVNADKAKLIAAGNETVSWMFPPDERPRVAFEVWDKVVDEVTRGATS
ncbi:hypothetical protein [Zavarzinella formosa]|uniref:hypothetical protein n=1 Tax=Zavarzinella formosa TaxID=360055 RepID=UPI0002E483A7|nr:hypothetical protein [Zavarzinella formosa]